MNKVWRCEARDENGHRCNRKAGHTNIAPTNIAPGAKRSKDRAKEAAPRDGIRLHSAFGREW